MDLQLSLLARLPLPINAILTSGGKSVHAWVRVNCKTVETYRTKVNELLALLKSFGIDQSNKNPSRLSRLPGAARKIGAGEDGRQRLLYLAPDRTDSKPILKA
jgi:RecA-family ATPase